MRSRRAYSYPSAGTPRRGWRRSWRRNCSRPTPDERVASAGRGASVGQGRTRPRDSKGSDSGGRRVTVPPQSPALLLGGRTFPPGRTLVMAIINRTPDSFYSRSRQYADDVAAEAVDRAVAE